MVTIKIDQLRKTYGGIVAVDGMDLEVASGSIHAIVGENGAGKSTLMKALAGAVRPDAGSISLDGEAVELASARAARAARHRHRVPGAEHPSRPPAAGQPVRQPRADPLRAGRRRGRWSGAPGPVLARLGLDVDLDVPVGSVSIAERQLIELARVLLRAVPGADPRRAQLGAQRPGDPAAVRDPARAGRRGDHRAVRVAPPRGGLRDRRPGDGDARRAGDPDPRHAPTLTIPEVVEAMVGTKQDELFPARTGSVDADGAVARRRRADASAGGLVDVSFEARPGEIVGLAGIAGSGIELLLGALFGERRASAGTVRYPDGGPLPTSPDTSGPATGEPRPRRPPHAGSDARPQCRQQRRPGRRRRDARRSTRGCRGGPPTPSPTGRSAGSASRPPDHRAPVVGAVGRQPAEGRARQVAGGVARPSSCSTTRRGASTSAPSTRSTRSCGQLADAGRIVLLRSTELPEIVGLADRILVFYRGRLATECRGCRRRRPSDLLRADQHRRPVQRTRQSTNQGDPTP